jgi:hypothetical protein
LDPLPFTGAPGFAVQTAVLSAEPVYQTEKEKAFSPASRKPQEKVASRDTRKGRAWSSTDREEPAPSCDGAADDDEHGEREWRKIRRARQVDFPSILHRCVGTKNIWMHDL